MAWTKVGPIKGRGGKQIGTKVRNDRTGQEKVLLNPHGKYSKATAELQSNVCMTNNGEIKKDKHGNAVRPNAKQRAFRAGYRSAVIDQTKAYKSKHGGKK